ELDANAEILELGGGGRLIYVTSADLVAARQVHARQRRDTRAADSHQVDLHFCRATSRSTSRTRTAASRRPAAADAFAIASRRGALRPSMVATRLCGVSSASPMRTAAPASTIAAAFSSWWPPPNVPGTRIMGRPTAVASAIVPTPARLKMRSARD